MLLFEVFVGRSIFVSAPDLAVGEDLSSQLFRFTS